jgi:hypothetical protein
VPPLRHALTAAVMNEDAQRRATEFLKELYAAGGIDAGRFNTGVAGLLAATTDTELAEVVRSLPPPVALTSPDRRLAKPLEIHSGMRRLRLSGRWQVARETHVSADLGSVRIDLTEAEFDDRVIDLHVYTGEASRSSCRGASASRSSTTGAASTRGWNRRCPGSPSSGLTSPRASARSTSVIRLHRAARGAGPVPGGADGG